MKISILITSYNRPEELNNCIQSVLKQNFHDFELIISDDCSPKFSKIKQVVNEFKDERILLIQTKSNLGFVKNLQHAYSYVSGRYILYISDDDLLLDSDFLKDAESILDKDKSIDILLAKMAKIIEGSLAPASAFKIPKGYLSKNELINNFPKLLTSYVIGSMLIKKEVFSNFFNLPTNMKYFDDLSVFNLIVNSSKFYFLENVVYGWTQEKNSRSNSDFHNLGELTKFFLTVPLYIHENYEEKYIDMINEYILERMTYIESYYMMSYTNDKFKKICDSVCFENKEIYIYGKSEIGIALKNYLEIKEIFISGFIDDFKEADDLVKIDSIDDNLNVIVIIGTYKAKLAFQIYKKLSRMFKSISIIDLIDI